MQNDIKAQLKQDIDKICQTHDTMAESDDIRRLATGLFEIDQMIGGGLAMNEMHEMRCDQSRHIACLYGFLFALLSRLGDNLRSIFLVNDPANRPDGGVMFPQGLHQFGIDSTQLVNVHPNSFHELLWSAGEAAKTKGLSATILHIKGNPKAFDLSASRKLMLRAQANNAPIFLVRQAAGEEASSAATRWCIEPALSTSHNNHIKALGRMRLRLSLEKNRNGQKGQWAIAWNANRKVFEHAVPPPHAHTQSHDIAADNISADVIAANQESPPKSDPNNNPKDYAKTPRKAPLHCTADLKLSLHPSANGQNYADEMGQILAFKPTQE